MYHHHQAWCGIDLLRCCHLFYVQGLCFSDPLFSFRFPDSCKFSNVLQVIWKSSLLFFLFYLIFFSWVNFVCLTNEACMRKSLKLMWMLTRNVKENSKFDFWVIGCCGFVLYLWINFKIVYPDECIIFLVHFLLDLYMWSAFVYLFSWQMKHAWANEIQEFM